MLERGKAVTARRETHFGRASVVAAEERKRSMSRVEVGGEGAMSQGVPRRISHCVGREELTRVVMVQGEGED